MVNKNVILTKRRAWSRLFFICACSLIISGTKAQNISGEYTSSIQEDGTLYFVLPQKGFRSTEDRNKFVYDLTYHTANDSVLLNFTYYEDQPVKPQRLTFFPGSDSVSSRLKKIFIEPSGKRWEYRYSANFAFEDMQKLFSQKEPPTLQLSTEDSITEMEIKKRKWKKQSAVLSKIMKMISLNKDP